MKEECKNIRERIIDEFYAEQHLEVGDLKHINNCDECHGFRRDLIFMETTLPRNPLEAEASREELIFIEEVVREQFNELNSKEASGHLIYDLAKFIIVAILLMSLMGFLFYHGVGPDFLQIQIFGLFIFPLIIPIIGSKESRRNRTKGEA